MRGARTEAVRRGSLPDWKYAKSSKAISASAVNAMHGQLPAKMDQPGKYNKEDGGKDDGS